MSYPRCRLCSAELRHTFVDLGMSPPCESYLTASQLDAGETFYPLHVRVCESCLLVQLPAYIAPEDVFSDYAYFSSYSDSWVAHARRFVDDAATRLGLGEESFVVEVASNDGYLLQHSVARGIRSLGIEPAANIAEVARAKGIDTEVMFLGEQTGRDVASRHGKADLVVANNVFAHVPDIVDFSKGLRALVADSGRVSIEIPHLLRLIEGNEYDTIYHEHYSYLTLLTATACACQLRILTVVDIEELPTHGGSMRIWSAPAAAGVDVAAVRAHGCWPTKPRLVSTPSRATTALLARWRLHATTSSSSSSAASALACEWPATGHRVRATRCSTIAASARISWSSRWIAIRTSTACSCQALTSRSTRWSGWRRSDRITW